MTELIFGIGIPAAAGPGDDPVGLARESERLGYDFVSAADHPAGSSPSYETTTMLTWIAARTSRIKVASRVLAVPFRRPAMVAKLAASLDALSGGRLILGLGAGYSDQEIAAVGGPAQSPAAKIDGLAEAIGVIRGAWTCSGYSQDGRHYSVRDLEMEPRPSPPVPIWLGAFGPRALAVTGALADGWIPSLGYRPTEEFPAMRRRIDEAALAAGRRPDEIRGILNLNLRLDPGAEPEPDSVAGSPGQVISQLRDLLGLGFTGFNFLLNGPDRAAAMRRVADEVLPALRSAD
ncbi:MAG TPA: LLM class flavin-dependent oxidoreductase [Streptosporangiaceae bacterium]|jgi:alkanesulfonate monooxygenase SsuD/methylene tetrahydromethanopterin reductase-like flavin-dependent oxidoreductase (luciferase family)|nr:LLM class flavin-dependent oxidoreductase [Streptosporangiaceae bacterium]